MPTLDPTGYDARDLNEVMNDLRTAARVAFGDDINLSASGKLGTILGIFAESIADIEKASQSLYDAFNRDNATGQQLDNLAAIIGLERLSPVKATALADLAGTSSTSVPSGSLVANTSGEQFTTLDSAVIPASGVRVEAVDYGTADVASAAIDTIITAITGWDSVSNPSSGSSGRAAETDAELRARMAEAPSVIGACTVEAIRADLQAALSSALGVLVVENTTMAVDANGLAPKSFRSILYPNTLDPLTIATTLWKSKPAGIATDGSESLAVTDSMGISHTMLWSWASDFYVEVIVDLTGAAVGPSYPGDAAVQDVIKASIDALGIGEAVRAFNLTCAVSNGVEGINDIVVTYRQKGGGSYIGTPLTPSFDGKPLVELLADVTVLS